MTWQDYYNLFGNPGGQGIMGVPPPSPTPTQAPWYNPYQFAGDPGFTNPPLTNGDPGIVAPTDPSAPQPLQSDATIMNPPSDPGFFRNMLSSMVGNAGMSLMGTTGGPSTGNLPIWQPGGDGGEVNVGPIESYPENDIPTNESMMPGMAPDAFRGTGGDYVPSGDIFNSGGIGAAGDPFSQLLQQYLNDQSGFLAGGPTGPFNNDMPLPTRGADEGFQGDLQFDQSLPPPANLNNPFTTAPDLPTGAQVFTPTEQNPFDPTVTQNAFGITPEVAPAVPVDQNTLGDTGTNAPGATFNYDPNALIPPGAPGSNLNERGPLYPSTTNPVRPPGFFSDLGSDIRDIGRIPGMVGDFAGRAGDTLSRFLGMLGTSTPFNDPTGSGFNPVGQFGGNNPFVGGAFRSSPGGIGAGGPLGTGSHGRIYPNQLRGMYYWLQHMMPQSLWAATQAWAKPVTQFGETLQYAGKPSYGAPQTYADYSRDFTPLPTNMPLPKDFAARSQGIEGAPQSVPGRAGGGTRPA